LKRASWFVALGIALYFVYFAHGALRAHFAVDDPMNLGIYWKRGLWANLADVVMLWRHSYRPMGAVFYLPIYDVFGMNPLPYRIAVMALLAANVFLSFDIARRLTKSLAAAALTAVLVCAHASMTTIYYNTSMIYDILAFFFTALMLWVYMRWRGNPVAGVGVVLAFLAAVNSKEIAVAGAAWLVAYELLFYWPWGSDVLPSLTRGVPQDSTEPRPSGRGVPVIVLLIAIAFTAARALGPNSLSKEPGYQLQITAHRFLINARIYLNDLFYTERSSRSIVIVWALTAIFCLIVRKRELWWAWFAASTAMLPVIFTVQPRNGGSLYLPLLAVALWMATAATILFMRWPVATWAAAALAALLMVPDTVHYWNERADWLLRDQQLTWTVLTQIRDLPARPKPGSRVLIEKNPFRDWDTWFMANLVWNDHTLDIKLLDHLDKPEDPEHFQWVLTFEGDRLKVIRAPGS
jgi:hypothetical protein